MLHPKQARPKTCEVATDYAPIGVGGSSRGTEVAPPTTEVEVVKPHSGRQKGGEVAQAGLNNDAYLLRIDARLSVIERQREGLAAIQWSQQELRAMVLALCCHQGITPSLHSGFSVAAASASTHSMVSSPVTGLSTHSIFLRHAGANGNMGHEYEEPSQNIGGPSSVSRGSARVDAIPLAGAPAKALPKSPVEGERNQGSAKGVPKVQGERNRELVYQLDHAKDILSGITQDMEGIGARLGVFQERLLEVTKNLQAVRLHPK